MIDEILAPIDPQTRAYLGPATVLAIQGRRVQLECPDEFPWAILALVHTYEPVEGDVVLAISRGQEWYVIGVIEGHGPTTITAPADLALRAPGGRVILTARDGIQLESSRVEIAAGRLEVTARSLIERLADVTRWVRDTIHTRAGRVSTEVEGDYDLRAGEIAERADGDVRIDGKTIHLA